MLVPQTDDHLWRRKNTGGHKVQLSGRRPSGNLEEQIVPLGHILIPIGIERRAWQLVEVLIQVKRLRFLSRRLRLCG